MSSFLWQIAKAAIVDKSPVAVKIAAVAIASRIPVSATRIEELLTKLVELVTDLGDNWLGIAEATLTSGMLSTPQEAAKAGFYGSALPSCDAPDCPHELQDFRDVVVAFRQA